jgi:hypothetical protein
MAIPPRPVNSGYTDQMLWRISKQLERLINVTGKVNTTTTTTTAP